MIIEINDLVKYYDDLLALNHFTLTVNKGEILGLLGPNGSGKTTAINCMLSLLTYEKGEIKLFDQKMSPKRYDLKKKIGVVPQEVAVFEELTVEQNIDYFCGLYILDKTERKQHVEEAIEHVGLKEFTKFIPSKLSGGLKRRLNIACGIAHKPELIFLDEPTVAVDPQSRNRILDTIKELNVSGATIVYTSHYMEEIEQLCSRIIIMDKGEVIAEGTKESLKQMIKTGEKVIIEIPEFTKEIESLILQQTGVLQLDYEGTYATIKIQQNAKILIQLLHLLEENQVIFGNFYCELPTLNDVFLEITGKKLRD